MPRVDPRQAIREAWRQFAHAEDEPAADRKAMHLPFTQFSETVQYNLSRIDSAANDEEDQ
jgi:hypothetical protein